MPTLTIRTLDGSELSYRLSGDVVRIGRSSSNDLVLADVRTSGRHAELRRRGSTWLVVDIGSRNGIQVNGKPVATETTLADRDRLEIGSTTLTFLLGDPPGDDLASGTPITIGAHRSASPDEEMRAVLVGSSPAMQAVRTRIARAASSTASVLLLGESGTGKELVARLLHRLSPRVSGPYEPVNCPALSADLVEAELFGVERGSATGVDARAGRLELAAGGTLFLDEVADLEPQAQAKLLRFLQDHVIERVGGRRRIALDVRVVAATNRDLEAAIATGQFRRDLYHRLNVVTITLPPLRTRLADVGELADAFLRRHPGESRTFAPRTLDALMEYDYPGNVRELEHIIESLRVLAEGPRFEPEHLPDVVTRHRRATRAGTTAPAPGAAAGAALYRRIHTDGESFWTVVREPLLAGRIAREDAAGLLLRVYREAGGSHKRAAELLGIAGEHKRFLDFVRYHRLRVRDLLTGPGPAPAD